MEYFIHNILQLILTKSSTRLTVLFLRILINTDKLEYHKNVKQIQKCGFIMSLIKINILFGICAIMS
jgi:hypothetical protein